MVKKVTSKRTDIVRDIKWVYQNLGELFTKTECGRPIIDEEVLEHAPSAGAKAMANYAFLDQKHFFDKFVIKLLPRDTTKVEEQSKSAKEQMELLDPTFVDMKDFFSEDKDDSN